MGYNSMWARDVAQLANELGFKDPADPLAYLAGRDVRSPDSLRRALNSYARQHPWLLNTPPVAEHRPRALSADQVRGMDADEINAQWDQVASALEREGSTGVGTR